MSNNGVTVLTGSNHPEVKDEKTVENIIRTYYLRDNVVIGLLKYQNKWVIEIDGKDFPGMVKNTKENNIEKLELDTLDAVRDVLYGGEGDLEQFMLEVAPYLKERFIVETFYRELLGRMELTKWWIEPNGTKVLHSNSLRNEEKTMDLETIAWKTANDEPGAKELAQQYILEKYLGATKNDD